MPRHSQVARIAQLRRMLNDWDFTGAGLLNGADDEYDCMVGPLLNLLASGAFEDEVADFLADHFGRPGGDEEFDAFAARLVGWWSAPEAAGV
jgi:hypothetical protein